MNLLYFTNIPSPYRVEFFNQINKKCETTVLFNYDKKEKYRNNKWYENNNYDFKCINLSKFGLFQLNKILNETKYENVIIGTYASLNAALLIFLLKIKKIKFFINADGGIVPEKETIISKFLKKFFITKADFYLSSGNETNKYLTYYGADKSKIYLYPFSSLKQEDILKKPISYEEKLKIRKKKGYNYKKIFISVGSFIYRKGYDIFLDAIKDFENDDVCFIIVGGGEEKTKYLNYINENKIKNLYLIDFCSKEEIFEFYKMSDVFFFPSREDIWGLVINEAMACGLPIISSNKVVASKELLNQDCLYDCYNQKELLNKINRYVEKNDKDLYLEGLENLEKIQNYSIENIVNKYIEIFSEVS